MNKLKLKQFFRTTIFSTITAIIVLAILFAAFSIIVLYANISVNLINQITTILGAISLFISAFITARIINKNGLLIGGTIGITTTILILLITFLSTNVLFNINTITKVVIISISSCLGGVLGVNSKN